MTNIRKNFHENGWAKYNLGDKNRLKTARISRNINCKCPFQKAKSIHCGRGRQHWLWKDDILEPILSWDGQCWCPGRTCGQGCYFHNHDLDSNSNVFNTWRKITEFLSIMNFSIKMAKCSREQPSGNDVRRPRSLLPPLPDVRAADDAGAPQPALWQGRQDHGEIPVKDRYLRTWAVALFHNSVWHNYVLSLQFITL